MKTKLKYIIPMLMLTMTACASPSDSKETIAESNAVTSESADTASAEHFKMDKVSSAIAKKYTVRPA